MPKILSFEKNSVLKKYGLKAGDELTAFDGYRYVDDLDYLFFDAKEDFTVTYLRSGESITVRIKKDGDRSMGAVLEDVPIEPIECRNKCVFCFVDQMKKGMRETLYIKDDDYRLSVISGNYITLTNLSREDVDRIKRLRLSPLYVSVHAFDGAVRKKMLNNRFADQLPKLLNELKDAGITFHTQIVLVEGMNDGEILRNTISELYALYPSVLSVAIVPVGLTRYREGLCALHPISRECADKTIDFAEEFGTRALSEIGSAFVWCSDEMYLAAARTIPPYGYYGDFCQIENGVGLVAQFIQEIRDYAPIEYSEKRQFSEYSKKEPNLEYLKIELVTGKSFYPVISGLVGEIEQKIKGVKLKVVKIENRFFGEAVTVAGLLTGTDIADQLRPDDDTYAVFFPRVMLREFEEVFLDGMTLRELQKILKKPVVAAPSGGYDWLEFLDEFIANAPYRA